MQVPKANPGNGEHVGSRRDEKIQDAMVDTGKCVGGGQRLEDSQRYNTKNDLPPQLLNIFGLLLDLHYKYVLNRSICMCAFICSYLTQSLSSTIINPFQSLVECVGSIPEK